MSYPDVVIVWGETVRCLEASYTEAALRANDNNMNIIPCWTDHHNC